MSFSLEVELEKGSERWLLQTFEKARCISTVDEAIEDLTRRTRELARKRVHRITGLLAGSLTHRKTSSGRYIIRGVYYGAYEERRPGTKHGTPHSFLRPALRDEMKGLERDLEKLFK